MTQRETAWRLPGGRHLVFTWAHSPVAYGRLEDMFFVKPAFDVTQVYEHGQRRATQLTLGRLALTLLHAPSREDLLCGPPAPSTSMPATSNDTQGTHLRYRVLGKRRFSLLQASRPFGYLKDGYMVVVRAELSSMHLEHAPLQARPIARRLLLGRRSFWVHPEVKRQDPSACEQLDDTSAPPGASAAPEACAAHHPLSTTADADRQP